MERENLRSAIVDLHTKLAGDNPNYAALRIAGFYAVMAHVILALLMPSLPIFELPSNSRASILNVFLNRNDSKEEFEQSLNRPYPNPNSDQALFEPVLGAASPELGEQSLVSEAAAEQVAQNDDDQGDKSAGKTTKATLKPVLRTDLAFVRMFAQQEAKIYAEAHPEEVERFRRSFNNQRNYRRRNKTDAFTNRYGDYYSRTNSSTGDVCFLQRPGENRDELATNIVYFFVCGEEPMTLSLDEEND